MVVEGYLEGGAPVGSKALSAEVQWGPSTIRHELASLEERGPARPSAHVRRPRPDRGRLPVLRRPPAADRAHGPAAGAVAGAPRARRGDARDDRDAVAGHQPAGDRHRAADRDLDDPPHRGAAAAAAGADGRGDHLDGRRDQAAVHVLAPDRPRARRLGGELSERAAGRPRARRADAPPAAARPVAVGRRARVPRGALAGVHRARGERSGRPVRRGHLAAADAATASPRCPSSTR